MKAHDNALQSIFSTLENLSTLEELDSNEENYLNQWINEGKITDRNTLETVMFAMEQKRAALTLQNKLYELSLVMINEKGEMREKWNKAEEDMNAGELKKILKKIEKLNAAYDALVEEIVEKTDFLKEEEFDAFIEEIEVVKDYLSSSKEVYESELQERKEAALLEEKINHFISEWALAKNTESSFLLKYEELKNEVSHSTLNSNTKIKFTGLLDVVPSYFLEKNMKDMEKDLSKFETSPSRSIQKNIRELYRLKFISDEMDRQIKNDSHKQFLADKINRMDERISKAYAKLQDDIFLSKTFGKRMSNLSRFTEQLNKERIKIQDETHFYSWGQKKRAIKKIEMLEKKIEYQQKYLENMYPDYENKIASLASPSHKKIIKYQGILSNAREALTASRQIFPDIRGPAGFIYQKLKSNAKEARESYERISGQPSQDISSLYKNYQTAISNIDKTLAMYADMQQDKKSWFARLKGGPIVELLKQESPSIKELKEARETLVNNFKEKALNAMDFEIKNEQTRAQVLNDHTSGRDALTIMYSSFLKNLDESIKQHSNIDEIMRHYQSLQSLKSNVDLEENIRQFKILQIQDLTEKMQVIDSNINEWKNRFSHQSIFNNEIMTAHQNLLEELNLLQNPFSYFDENTSQQNLDRIGSEIISLDMTLFRGMSADISSLANDEVEKIKLLSINANEKNLNELSLLQEQIEDSVNHVNHTNVVSVYHYLHKLEEDIEKIESSMKADNLYYAQQLMEKRKNTMAEIHSLQDDFSSAVIGPLSKQLDSIQAGLHQLSPMEIFNQNNLSYQQLKEEDERLQKLMTQFQAISGSIHLQSILDKEIVYLKECLNDDTFSHPDRMTFNKHNLHAAYFLLNDVIGKKQLETGNESHLYAFIELTQAISERNFEKMSHVYADFLKSLPDSEKSQVKNLIEDAMSHNYHSLVRAQHLLENSPDCSLSQIQKIKKQNYDTILSDALNRLNVFISSLQHNEKANLHYFLHFYDIEKQQMKSDYAWLFAHNKEFNVTFNRALELANQRKLLEFSRQRPVLKSLKELDVDKKRQSHYNMDSPRFFSNTIKPDVLPEMTERPKPKNK